MPKVTIHLGNSLKYQIANLLWKCNLLQKYMNYDSLHLWFPCTLKMHLLQKWSVHSAVRFLYSSEFKLIPWDPVDLKESKPDVCLKLNTEI